MKTLSFSMLKIFKLSKKVFWTHRISIFNQTAVKSAFFFFLLILFWCRTINQLYHHICNNHPCVFLKKAFIIITFCHVSCLFSIWTSHFQSSFWQKYFPRSFASATHKKTQKTLTVHHKEFAFSGVFFFFFFLNMQHKSFSWCKGQLPSENLSSSGTFSSFKRVWQYACRYSVPTSCSF